MNFPQPLPKFCKPIRFFSKISDLGLDLILFEMFDFIIIHLSKILVKKVKNSLVLSVVKLKLSLGSQGLFMAPLSINLNPESILITFIDNDLEHNALIE